MLEGCRSRQVTLAVHPPAVGAGSPDGHSIKATSSTRSGCGPCFQPRAAHRLKAAKRERCGPLVPYRRVTFFHAETGKPLGDGQQVLRLGAQQAAAWLDMKVCTLRNRIKNREIVAIKDGKGYWLEEADIEAYDRCRKIAIISRTLYRPCFGMKRYLRNKGETRTPRDNRA